ncbi:MAG: Dol-P-Glc:Glc(2)Man(9)GlcNAc(2)-PP-Dol alpha-1,2-glucosyltransferase [Verrucomicrobiales bacterium]|jgi:alpha-1,2-glucosyltransferase|nr:Dol-P-Glc:Glc(2)Man(9)GlcNAc(2)-PP-Dol alpha-1,2-glucosyltransferase [Verrucomicrobiales bacterium]
MIVRFLKQSSIWPWLLIGAVLLIVFQLFCFHEWALADERFHLRMIDAILNGASKLPTNVSVFPTYHAIMAVILSIFEQPTLPLARLVSFCVSGAAPFLFVGLCNQIGQQNDYLRWFQFLFIPIILPFYPLVYMDIWALIPVLIALERFYAGKQLIACFIMTAGLALRQTNLFWVWFLCWLFFYQAYHGDNLKTAVIDTIKKTWPCWLGMAVFAGVILVNGSVAVGDKSNQGIAFDLTQVYFFLIVCFLLFLPLHLAQVPQILKLLKEQQWILWILPVAVVFFFTTFKANHPYNSPEASYFVRNRLLHWIQYNYLTKGVTFIVLYWSILTFTTIKLRRPEFYGLYPMTILALLPMPLIEPRYYMIPLALIGLFREKLKTSLEIGLLVYWVILSALVITMIKFGWGFL